MKMVSLDLRQQGLTAADLKNNAFLKSALVKFGNKNFAEMLREKKSVIKELKELYTKMKNAIILKLDNGRIEAIATEENRQVICKLSIRVAEIMFEIELNDKRVENEKDKIRDTVQSTFITSLLKIICSNTPTSIDELNKAKEEIIVVDIIQTTVSEIRHWINKIDKPLGGGGDTDSERLLNKKIEHNKWIKLASLMNMLATILVWVIANIYCDTFTIIDIIMVGQILSSIITVLNHFFLF